MIRVAPDEQPTETMGLFGQRVHPNTRPAWDGTPTRSLRNSSSVASPSVVSRNVTVMLATYNEAGAIAEAIQAISDAARELFTEEVNVRLFLVDDESPDGTAAIATRTANEAGVQIKVSSGPRAGLGLAYLRGMAAIVADGWTDTIVTLDADGQHDPRVIPTLVRERERRNLDLLIGSRWVEGGLVLGLSRTRRSLSRVGNRLFAVVTGTTDIHDATTSFRVFTKDFASSLDVSALEVSGYSFFSSFVGVASASGYRIGEYPITFAPRSSGNSKLAAHDLMQFLRNLPRLGSVTRALRRRQRAAFLPDELRATSDEL